jgi:transposase
MTTSERHDHLVRRLNTANGEVYGLCQQKHRHQEWLRFLRMIDKTIPAGKEIYLICDNYATHKHERVHRWLEKHKRFHVRFTPTSASWLNMVGSIRIAGRRRTLRCSPTAPEM